MKKIILLLMMSPLISDGFAQTNQTGPRAKNNRPERAMLFRQQPVHQRTIVLTPSANASFITVRKKRLHGARAKNRLPFYYEIRRRVGRKRVDFPRTKVSR